MGESVINNFKLTAICRQLRIEKKNTMGNRFLDIIQIVVLKYGKDFEYY